jgi:multiple sugar transport system permease protein
MMRGFFAEVPVEMEEAALVDGCSPWAAFWRIALPLTTPGLVATGVFCFIFSWSELFFGVCLTQTKAIPLAVQLPMFFGKQMIMWGNVGALSVLAILPLIVMSFFVQRYLVRGLTMGAVR